MAVEYYDFGPHKIHHSSVFYTSNLSFAFVNLRPAVTGHVLVCSKREVKRVADLTDDETIDLWRIAKKLGRQLESYHKASSLSFGIQDGPQAGQTVPHVHIHILPWKSGDYENNDDIYDDMNEKEKELNRALKVDVERKDRSIEEMALEADEYRKFVF
ncbi:bifunctional bis(5'-adenosyl)-triphosphatase/adenylylsulfatase FHIT-like [Glycine soja]|uniref:bifunctional bis(5'-adenosyl)-triphosphatase/adenylylsulfatase FHIT n=1 Tax=Glycine max TaxID=3847 RepID=UPI000233DFEC|nr:bifunctional bis(5'-adenosyl)-triphosphatase/adenylylsulfatase FHIT [Glycine max]XP_028212913.1 bifunctional bis(5'-adenosyl)-triphosphatase/adenylylsulfatase FHIT-like [Glycine soja]|eukprot:XP_006602046.1 bifunctional bis(5'-adenosyl)-triphosphatase/adenylylsulfatase FHIT [Glycine max]